MNPKKRQQLAALRAASPLQMAGALKEMELYDKKTAQEIIDEVYAKYATGQDLQEEVVEPVMLSVLDGLLEKSKWGRQARKKGLTASRVISECRTFSYDSPTPYAVTNDGYVDYKNMREYRIWEEERNKAYNRENLDSSDDKERFMDQRFNGVGKTIRDDYSGELIYRKNNKDERRSEYNKNRFIATVDHVVPLEKMHEMFLGKYTLKEADIKEIANKDYNYAAVGSSLNSSKNDDLVPDYIKKKGDLLPEETRKNMEIKYEKAMKKIKIEIAKKAVKNVSEDAACQQVEYFTGNVLLYVVKPLYYELSDIVRNGLKNGVGANSFKEAMRIRFGRVKAYVVDNAKNFMGDNVKDFVKGFVSSLIEGIIGLFTGAFRNFLKLCKEGVRMLSSSWKIIKGEKGKTMSSAEKKQAIARIVGAGVIAVAGIAFEEWLNATFPGLGREWSVIISTIMSGVGATLFFYFLNKADLFSVKAERRHARLEEIFNERIKEIETTAADMNTTALETMRQQREEFENVCDGIEEGLANDDIDKISAGWYRMADFLHVDLSFHNTDEFLDYTDKMLADSAAK